ncbi:glutaredoxin family protein [Pseudoalteromonas sp. JBTF-M23]|uniref:Glutaredoxin family protein n=1 Tax=Pseudoalteromonas caenipelagi TaxID=2726988 RepID=A0A849V8X1_9GAMM|nr:glutaredoxin family protein [Pseudoalteromonas caenipelagi]NOU49368.1 glutaredoxin family protein [Pseudoalteromonas caenipelagi]
MAKYVLYHTEGCHLCEQALELILQLIPSQECELVDILSDEALMVAYQTSIPVIKRCSDEQVLYWPFDQQKIQQLVE